MAGEKRDSKGGGNNGGFFQLFDRNNRSKWKKLFSNKSALPVESEQEKVDGEKLPSINFHMMDDERRSESSRLSSVSMDDEGMVVKASNVIARLMGLDSLPFLDVHESNSIPFHEPRSTYGPKKSLEFGSQYHNMPNIKQSNNSESFPSKITDPRPQKLQRMSLFQKRPFERFQTETLPAKPVKSYSDIQHKLLSPIKSSGFVSAKNAAHLMETAAKILEPGLHPVAKSKSAIILPSSITSRSRVQPEDTVFGYKISKPLELPKEINEPDAVKFLKGQSMNKSWNGPENGPSYSAASEGRLSKNLTSSLPYQNTTGYSRKLPSSSMKREKQVVVSHDLLNSEDGKLIPMNQGKSVSLAVQAIVNVQKRESLSYSSIVEPTSTTGLTILHQDDQRTLRQQRKSQPNIQRNKQKQAVSTVLRQNNQKQNRLPSKSTASNQHIRKDMAGDTSLCQKLTDNEQVRDRMVAGGKDYSHSRKAAYSKASDKGINKNDVQKKTYPLQTSTFHRKKRLTEGGLVSDKYELVNTIFIGDGGKTPRETNEISSAYLNQMEFNKRSLWSADQAVSSSSKSMDVVSFTFTSPLSSTSGSHPTNMASGKQRKKASSTTMVSDKQNINNGCSTNVLSAKSSRLSTTGSMPLEGDTLSALLEKKLRELTSGIQMASSLKAANSGTANTVSILQDFLATLNSGVPMSKELDSEGLCISQKCDKLCIYDDADSSSSSTLMVNIAPKFQVEETVRQPNFDMQRGDMNLMKMDSIEENERLSPVSILDAAFPNDSCISLDSSDGTFGGQIDQSCEAMIPSIAAEKELLDSATSMCMGTVERPGFPGVAILEELNNVDEEMEYIKGIVVNTNLMLTDLAVGPSSSIVDPLLFDRLENYTIYESVDDQKQVKTDRKLLFDCVSEYVDSKFCRYSRDCRVWKKGVSVVESGAVVEEVFKEMLGWRSMGELMVDEILDKDMSVGPGKWRDYENEEFETGLEIEEDILDYLIEEVVTCTFGLEV